MPGQGGPCAVAAARALCAVLAHPRGQRRPGVARPQTPRSPARSPEGLASASSRPRWPTLKIGSVLLGAPGAPVGVHVPLP
eukprot:10137206-Alexandrium_andersonii.AAC.1